MKRPGQIKQELTRQWVEKAGKDYDTSSQLLSAAGDYFEAAAFHARQAAEK
ncbi:MAG: HEPN domain-containing protein [Deltaproteobacteria bacterium]|jgi:HEPN domain-containing protein|nr:HEPN domain-containing protein [Deltaproteobacteria bacterium]